MPQVDDRLVVEDELLALDRAPQVGAELEARDRRLAHRRHEPLVRAAAARLGRVHRGVGVAQQVRRPCRRRPATAMPTLARSATSTPPTASGAPSDSGDALGDLLGVRGVGDVLEQERELVAAEAGDGVARADASSAAARRPPGARWSPAACPRLSLTALKSSRSTNRTTTPAVLPAAPLQRMRHAVGEQRAVGEAGERVVEGLARELRLEHLALGDVAVVDDDAADRGVVEQVASDRLHRPPRAVGVLDPELEAALGALARGEVGERLLHRRAVVVVDERGERPALPVGRRVRRGSAPRRRSRSGRGRRRRGSPGRRTSSAAASGTAPRGRAGRTASSTSRPFWLASSPRRRVERAPQHQEQDRRREPRDDEHVAPRRLDELDDRGRVLVDLVGADHRAVRRADRQVDLEEVAGQAARRTRSPRRRSGRGGAGSRSRPSRASLQVVVDVEGAGRAGTAGPRTGRCRAGDHSLIRAMPPGCTSRARSSSMSPARRSRRDRPSSPRPAAGRRSPGPWSRRCGRPRSRPPRSRAWRRRRR